MTSLSPPVANATGIAGSLCTSVYSHERSANSELLVGERSMIRSHREGGCANAYLFSHVCRPVPKREKCNGSQKLNTSSQS